MGFTVIEARDGEEALHAVRTHLPDLIITDLQMPYINGVEFCTQVAADERTSHIPAILLTARGHIINHESLANTVIRRTMAKPFSAKTLFENAQSVLAEAGRPLTIARPAPDKRPLTGEAA
jgi:CheY-like chemotaxis protein